MQIFILFSQLNIIGQELCQELHRDTKMNNAQALPSRNSALQKLKYN